LILITGGGGFIGLNLARALLDQSQSVVLMDLNTFEKPSFLREFAADRIQTVQGDAGDADVFEKIIREHQVESVIHAAVLTETSPGSTLRGAIRTNVQGTADILEVAREQRLKRVTFLSSVSVYFPCTEERSYLSEDNDLPATAADWIGGSKKAGEQICQLYARQYEMSIPIVRPAQVWGPLYWTGRNPVMAMLRSALEEKPIDLANLYGGARSACIYVRDCARAIALVHLAQSLKHQIYNIGDGQKHSLDDFARAISRAKPGTRIKLSQVKPENFHEPPQMTTQRLEDEFSFKPAYSLDKGVGAYLAWLQDGRYL
jgi:UDP-glucose 4-epimerase